MAKKRNQPTKRRQPTKTNQPVTFVDEIAEQILQIDEAELLLRQQSLLESRGLVRLFIPKDGACLFRAVSQALYHTQELHSVVRQQAGETIERFSDHFTPFIPEEHLPLSKYLGMIAHPSAWGGHIELSALSLCHSLRFRIYLAEAPESSSSSLSSEAASAAASSTEQPDGQPNKPDLQLQEYIISASVSPPGSTEEVGSEVALFFSNGNHYDLLYSREQYDRLAFCQSIVYELVARAVGNKTIVATTAAESEGHRYVNVGLEQWTRRQEREERESTELAQSIAAAFISPVSSTGAAGSSSDKLSDWIAVRGGRRYHVSQEEQDQAEQKRLEEEALQRQQEQDAARERVTQALTSDNPSTLFPALPKKSNPAPRVPLASQAASSTATLPDSTEIEQVESVGSLSPSTDDTAEPSSTSSTSSTPPPTTSPAPAKPFSWAAVAEKAPVPVAASPKPAVLAKEKAVAEGPSPTADGWTQSYQQKPRPNRDRDGHPSQRGDHRGARGSPHRGRGDRGGHRDGSSDRDRRDTRQSGAQSDRRGRGGRGDQERRDRDQRGRGRS